MATAVKRDPHAPIINERKHKRACVRGALENILASAVATPRNKASTRSFMREFDRLERARPDTTIVTVLRLTSTTKGDPPEALVWLYEHELAPGGSSSPSVRLPWSTAFAAMPK